MKQFTTTVISYLTRFLYIQLFITLGSLPILISWGLPLSIMSPVGNLLFTPFLMLFLLLSSLIFFLELLHIPNALLIYFLEKTVTGWTSVLSLNSPTWLIGFSQPSIVFFIVLIVATFFIVHHKKLGQPSKGILCFSLLLILAFSYLKWHSNPPHTSQLECNKGVITLFHKNNQTIMIDPGVLGRRASTQSWIEYTLLSELNKAYGSTAIDHLIILQPGALAFEAVEFLCKQANVKNIYLTSWHGNANKSFYRAYGLLKTTLSHKNSIVHRIGTYCKTIKIV